MTERLHFHFSFSCIGEGSGNPLQCSCLENPRDGGAWWAAVYGVAQSRTRLNRLSSSSSSSWRKFTTMTSLGSSLGWDTKLPHYLLKYYAFLELCTEIRIKVRKTCGVESMFLPRKYWRAEQSVFCRSLFTFKQNNMLSSRLKWPECPLHQNGTVRV